MDTKNIAIVIAISALSAYCLYLNAFEIAATGIGALAGVLTAKGATNVTNPPVSPDHNGV